MATLTWTTPTTGNWSTDGNWTPSGKPGAADTALFDGTGADLSFVNDFTIQALVVNDPSALITVSGTLEVTGNASIQAGTIALSSGTLTLNDLSNLGSITMVSGTALELTGTYDSDSVERIFPAGNGYLDLLGTMLNTGKVFDARPLTGVQLSYSPSTGTLVGGTIIGDSLGMGTFDGVTWQGTMLAQAYTGDLRFRNGLTVVDDAGVGPGLIDLSGIMVFEGDATLDNLALEAGGGAIGINAVTADGTLTLGAQSSFTATGASVPASGPRLTFQGTGPASTIVNFGTVQALAPFAIKIRSHDLNINVAAFHNHGVVAALSEDGGISSVTITADSFVNEVSGIIRIAQDAASGRAHGTVLSGVDFTNDGSVIVSSGSFVVNSAILGSGAVHVSDDGFVDFNDAVSAGQTVALNVSGTVDIAVPQLFQGTITGLTTGTTLHIDSQATAIAYASNVLTMQLGGGQTFDLNIMGASSLSDFIVNSGTTGTTISTLLPAPCFAAGTLIRTDRGDVPVEALQEGDLIRLAGQDGFRAALWIGHRAVDCARHPDPEAVWPVRVAAHAFGPGQPARDLFLSPDHGVFFENVLIPVKHLVDGRSITQVPVAAVSYFHVELDRHDVILAEGLAVESYLDTGDRDAFANGGPAERLFPVFGCDSNLVRDASACAPLVVTGPVLAAVRARVSRHDRMVA